MAAVAGTARLCPPRMEYTTSFATGGLMPGKAVRVIEAVRAGTPLQDVKPEVLNVNSRRGRQRKTGELKRRLLQTPRPVWEDLPDLDDSEQRLVLYYGCLKTYRMIFDFHMDVVLPTWRSVDRSLELYNVDRFFEQRSDAHPEIFEWSQSTRSKVRGVLLQMLREAGFLADGALQRVICPRDFWARFAAVGDVWYLEAAFLNESERRDVTAALRS